MQKAKDKAERQKKLNLTLATFCRVHESFLIKEEFLNKFSSAFGGTLDILSKSSSSSTLLIFFAFIFAVFLIYLILSVTTFLYLFIV